MTLPTSSPPSPEETGAVSRHPLSSDMELYHRHLGRRVLFWRLAAIAIFLVASGVVTRHVLGLGGDYVARISLEGVIYSDADRRAMLRDIAEDSRIRGVIVRINSPGGTVTGSESLFADFRNISAKRKPVVAVLEEIATSGGYVAALGSDHIVARHGTITGSIGVLFQWLEFSDMMEKVGVASNEVVSGPLKGQPSPFGAPEPQAVDMIQGIVDSGLDWFVDLVSERRGLERESVLALSDGRIFVGSAALQAGLVDGLGGEEEARAWMMEERDIPRDIPVRDVVPVSSPLASFAVENSFLPDILRLAIHIFYDRKSAPLQGGLFAIWKPER